MTLLMKQGKKIHYGELIIQSDITNNEIEKTFILETDLSDNTKQPFRWKFTQSHTQLSILSLEFNCLEKIMCSITNVLDTNIQKFDASKTFFFFCPEYLDSLNRKN